MPIDRIGTRRLCDCGERGARGGDTNVTMKRHLRRPFRNGMEG